MEKMNKNSIALVVVFLYSMMKKFKLFKITNIQSDFQCEEGEKWIKKTGKKKGLEMKIVL